MVEQVKVTYNEGQFLAKGFGLTALGSRKGTMSGDIDEALVSPEGLNPETFVPELMKKHGRTQGKAEGKLRAHLNFQVKRGIAVKAEGKVYHASVPVAKADKKAA